MCREFAKLWSENEWARIEKKRKRMRLSVKGGGEDSNLLFNYYKKNYLLPR